MPIEVHPDVAMSFEQQRAKAELIEKAESAAARSAGGFAHEREPA
ncbi:MAG TPA: hypothetical protein VMP01_08375 [Pirellulaceae bacterium]|nr:hypothetical protein [Pirellulaceae bacterium]